MLLRGSGEVRYALGALALLLTLASSGSAVPLIYNIVPSESSVSTSTFLVARADVAPDPLNQFPQAVNMFGDSTSQPSFGTTLTADVGLPGGFNNGANGITISQMEINYFEVLQLFSLGSIPLPLGGGASQAVAFVANVGNLNITLDPPGLTSELIATGNPGEYLWAGTANLTISGELSPSIIIPTVQTIDLPATPFSQSVPVALEGIFSGDAFHTEVTVGIPPDAIQNLNVSLPTIEQTVDPLGLGLVSLTFSFTDFGFAALNGSFVYTNPTPIPEPGTVALLCLGLAGFSALRRNRDRR
jgi:hypothetical protein